MDNYPEEFNDLDDLAGMHRSIIFAELSGWQNSKTAAITTRQLLHAIMQTDNLYVV